MLAVQDWITIICFICFFYASCNALRIAFVYEMLESQGPQKAQVHWVSTVLYEIWLIEKLQYEFRTTT